MKIMVVTFVICSCGTLALADPITDNATPAVKEMLPLRDCLKAEIASAVSKEAALSALETGCEQVAKAVRPKIREVAARAPVTHEFDVEKLVDGFILMLKASVYYEYSGLKDKEKKNR